MVVFEDLTDVDEWLEPMGYVELWDAVAPYRIFSIADRDHCDGLITSGAVDQSTILKGLKHMAYDGLRSRFGLTHRYHETVADQGLKSLH